MASSLPHPSPGLISFPPFPLPCSRPSAEGMEGRGASGCLGAGVHLLVCPELLVLLPAKALIIVAFALKQLLKVGFAVKFSVQRCIAAQAAEAEQLWSGRSGLERRGQGQGKGAPQLGVTVLAAEASVVENELVCHQPLHGVHSLLAGGTCLLHLGPKAEGLLRGES